MKTNSRLIRHLVFMLSITLIPILCYSIILYFGGTRDNLLYSGIIALLLSLNIMYSFFLLKSALWKKIVFAFTANFIGSLIAALLIRVGINVENDTLGIWKWLLGNALFTITIWEIIYQLTENSFSTAANQALLKQQSKSSTGNN